MHSGSLHIAAALVGLTMFASVGCGSDVDVETDGRAAGVGGAGAQQSASATSGQGAHADGSVNCNAQPYPPEDFWHFCCDAGHELTAKQVQQCQCPGRAFDIQPCHRLLGCVTETEGVDIALCTECYICLHHPMEGEWRCDLVTEEFNCQ